MPPARSAAAPRGRARRVGRSHEPLPGAAPGLYRLIGQTRDDAAGEAYDKVAKLVGSATPAAGDRPAGGHRERPRGAICRGPHDPPRSERSVREGRLDFSFSGVKTAVLRHVRAQGGGWSPARRTRRPVRELPTLVVGTLVGRTFAAARWSARGASASLPACRPTPPARRVRGAGPRVGLPVFVPSLALATDNAAMMAAAGLRRFHAGVRAGDELNAEAALRLTS